MKLCVLAVLASAALFGAGGSITARDVIGRIQKNVGVDWNKKTVDTFKAGNPDTRVTGIATTFAATLDVLQRAAASGKNLIITHEPTFYNHLDETAEFASDPVFRAKQEFIEKHGLVIFRFHDHWHMRKPDGVLQGMAEALGWQKFQRGPNEPVFAMPETTLDRLAGDIKDRMKIRTMRVIGDPKLKITTVGLVPGAAPESMQIQMLERDNVQAVVVGESREWETVEYVRDAVTEGKQKALIILGHVPSEEAGMRNCAQWLKTFVTEVPIEFIPAGEPFWSPK